MFNSEQLKSAIQSDIEIVAIWGAFQILKLENDQSVEFLSNFLQSPFPDIQDAGLAKIAELKNEEFTADIIRLFRESEGQLKYTAAYALSSFNNDITRALLQKWFEQLSTSNQSTRMEYDAAVFSFINLDRDAHYPQVVKTLYQSQSDIIKSSVLFTNLLNFCEEESEFKELTSQYFILRDQFSDAEITLHFIETLIPSELRDWWAVNLSKGYSISSIFRQCYTLLDFNENLTDQNLWMEIENAVNSCDSLHRDAIRSPEEFIGTTLQWVNSLLNSQHDDLFKLKWILEGFLEHKTQFAKTIPKIIELETQFILSVPLYIILEQEFEKWLTHPGDHVENIANYYHSTLLTKEYREKILNLFFPAQPEWQDEDLMIRSDSSPVEVSDNKNSIIWSFYRGELLGYNVPWPTIFPNPDCSLYLADGLARIFFKNFAYYIQQQDKISVDYALQLFQLRPSRGAIDLIVEHFDYLYQGHADTLFQTIEYLPDPLFLDHLLEHFEPDEQEIARLIILITKVFSIDLPESVDKEITELQNSSRQVSGVKKPVRLLCKNCNSVFQYPVDLIYIDEGAILRMNRLSEDSIWAPQEFNCKKCSAKVPFDLDKLQLDELSQQSRVDRILNITPQTRKHHFGFHTCLIDFPRYNGRTYKPGEFFELIEKTDKDGTLPKEELRKLWMTQARLNKAMMRWTDCRKALEKIKSLELIDEEWMFLMGLVCFKLGLHADSRKYFDWVLKKHPDTSNHAAFTPYVEKSRYYLKQLDSKDSKKARFKVITGKK